MPQKIKHSIGIVWATFNHEVTMPMRDHAIRRAKELNLQVVEVANVPGAYEIPLATKRMLTRKDIDGVVVLGAIRQGDTAHDEIVGHNAARACMDLMLEFNKPVGMGISGPRMDWPQAKERAQPFAERAVEAVAHMLGYPQSEKTLKGTKRLYSHG
jgi:6,7-dimethyl-8-ribityllumazine synthase